MHVPVEQRPADIFLADDALQHEVFDESSKRIGERGDDCGIHAKPAFEPRVALYSPPPSQARKWRVVENAFIARIEAQDDFAEAHQSHMHSRFGLTLSFAMILG
jgi:hypothetical protein